MIFLLIGKEAYCCAVVTVRWVMFDVGIIGEGMVGLAEMFSHQGNTEKHTID
jgi:hypothetical protein